MASSSLLDHCFMPGQSFEPSPLMAKWLRRILSVLCKKKKEIRQFIFSSKTVPVYICDGWVRGSMYPIFLKMFLFINVARKSLKRNHEFRNSYLREEHSSTNPPFLPAIGSISHKGTSVCLLLPPSCIVYQRTRDELLWRNHMDTIAWRHS